MPPKVVNVANVAAGAGRVADNTNADGLYQNYLGEYGLPAEVKPLLMRDMQRLANGFAVQLATGRDLKTNVEHFHATMRSATGQAMLARMAGPLMNGTGAASLAPGNGPSDDVLRTAPRMTDEELAHAGRARERDRALFARLQAVARPPSSRCRAPWSGRCFRWRSCCRSRRSSPLRR